MQELAEYELLPEEWGGQTPCVKLSAKTGEGIQDLLDTICLVSEVEELGADPSQDAQGTVLEANLVRARGVAASLLVQQGTLRVGDALSAGGSFGKVRSMEDSAGRAVEEAPPASVPPAAPATETA